VDAVVCQDHAKMQAVIDPVYTCTKRQLVLATDLVELQASRDFTSAVISFGSGPVEKPGLHVPPRVSTATGHIPTVVWRG